MLPFAVDGPHSRVEMPVWLEAYSAWYSRHAKDSWLDISTTPLFVTAVWLNMPGRQLVY